MRAKRVFFLGVLALIGVSGSAALAGGGWSVGVRIGDPGCYRPYYGGYYRPYYYRPYPVYVAPPPVIVQPAPVIQAVPIVQPTVVQPVYQTAAPPLAAQPVIAQSPVPDAQQADIERNLQL